MRMVGDMAIKKSIYSGSSCWYSIVQPRKCRVTEVGRDIIPEPRQNHNLGPILRLSEAKQWQRDILTQMETVACYTYSE
jgi:hypothetical protein